MRLLALLLAAVLAAAAPAAAQVNAGEAARQQAVRIATDWLEANTAYKHIPPVPVWKSLSGEQMAQQAVRGGVLGDPHQVSAIYACNLRTLFFRNDINFYDVAILSLLVHELTHHAQCQAHMPMNDLCRVETEAYRNQQAFVRGLPDRLARSGHPMAPDRVKVVVGFADNIDNLIGFVCKTSAAH